MHAAANDAVASQDGRQFNCRKAGSLNKRTVAKLQAAEYELDAARAGKKLAVDHMDDMVEYLKSLVDLLAPWNPDGTRREGREHDLWFRVVAAFQSFLAMRAPYQSPRLSAMAIVPTKPPPSTADLTPEDVVRKLQERGLPLSVLGADKPILELEASPPSGNGSDHVGSGS
jgi:hypothetical protein